jgi:hypothetical protein
MRSERRALRARQDRVAVAAAERRQVQQHRPRKRPRQPRRRASRLVPKIACI